MEKAFEDRPEISAAFERLHALEATVRYVVFGLAELAALRLLLTLQRGVYFEQIFQDMLAGAKYPLLTEIFFDYREWMIGITIAGMIAAGILTFRFRRCAWAVCVTGLFLFLCLVVASLASEAHFRPLIEVMRQLTG